MKKQNKYKSKDRGGGGGGKVTHYLWGEKQRQRPSFVSHATADGDDEGCGGKRTGKKHNKSSG